MKLSDDEIEQHRATENDVLRRALQELWEARKKYKDWDDGKVALALENDAAQRCANLVRNGEFADLGSAAAAIEAGEWRGRLGHDRGARRS